MSRLCMPADILKQHSVVLGKTGAGKSSALRHVAEYLLDRNKRVCIIDPKGDWYGLKIAADGRAPGYPVILFGDFKNDDAQDVPINDRSGKHVAELIASGNRPAIIGMRGWTHGGMSRFWIDFASTLFNTNAGELFLVGDEFHNFAPKQWKGMQDRENPASQCLHWSNRMLSEGRGIGLVCLLASQRPQKVHNDTLTSCETLIAMRVIHKADRDAVKAWIDGNGDPDVGKEVLETLAGMPRGDAWVWSPEIGFGPKRVTFPMFETFDSFAPPQLQKKVSSKGWAGVNLDEVKAKLHAVIEEEKANDPRELKAQVAKLKVELAKTQKAQPAPAQVKVETQRVEVKVVDEKAAARLEKVVERMEQQGQRLLGESGELRAILRLAVREGQAPPIVKRSPVAYRQLPKREKRVAESIDGLTLTKKQQQILDALAWLESIGVNEPSNAQLGAIALIDTSGGYFSNVAGPLASAGLIERGNGTTRLTDAGRAAANPIDEPPSLDAYHNVLRERVRKSRNANGKTLAILDALIEAGGSELSNEQIGEQVSIDTSGGYFSNSIGPLSTIGLIDRRAGVVRPTDLLFPPALVT